MGTLLFLGGIVAIAVSAIWLFGWARKKQGQAEVEAKANSEVRRRAEAFKRIQDEIANSDRERIDALGLRKRR